MPSFSLIELSARSPEAPTTPHIQRKILVNKGADVKAKDNDENTVLHSAAERGNEAVVHLLLGRGADVKTKDNHGSTVLHSAA